MGFSFRTIETNGDWKWQLANSLKTEHDFSRIFALSESERLGFNSSFKIRVTPYFAAVANPNDHEDPVRQMIMPSSLELEPGVQAFADPLAELSFSPTPRLVHRYPDRVLFLVTDTCALYCRYCLRKHFTGHDQAMIAKQDLEAALTYIQSTKSIREVILSGGDPLTLATPVLNTILTRIRQISHIEIIRIGSRLPVVCPMRIDKDLVQMLRQHKPVFLMTHFNHPQELTTQSADALEMLVDHGIPVLNQMVLLNGINNHPAIVQALSRRLLYLRVKPYYMHHCDPSEGTDHFRTRIEDSEEIQRALWGRLSGLAMPNLSIDLPTGGGKVGLTPDFTIERSERGRAFVGWDGRKSTYINPPAKNIRKPTVADEYQSEWNLLLGTR